MATSATAAKKDIQFIWEGKDKRGHKVRGKALAVFREIQIADAAYQFASDDAGRKCDGDPRWRGRQGRRCESSWRTPPPRYSSLDV